MMRRGGWLAVLAGTAGVVWAVSAGAGRAAEPVAKTLLDVGAEGAARRLVASCAQVSAAAAREGKRGVVVTIQPGPQAWPGARVEPKTGPWDLSAFGHVEATIVNTGAKPISVSLRVDNAGDWRKGPWNCESVYLRPGASGTVVTIFGYSYGRKPGYKLKPAAVTGVLLFCNKSGAVQSFRIESLRAAGPAGEKPPVDPKSIRIKPAGGVILGAGATIDAGKQIRTRDATAHVVKRSGRQSLVVTLPAGAKGDSSAALRPPVGRWDLRDCLEVRVRLTNAGEKPVWPRVRVESNGGPSEWAQTPQPLAPGATAELVASFLAEHVWDGDKHKGNRVTNDAVSGIVFSARRDKARRVLRVDSIVAGLPPRPAPPKWLGKRPPVEGDWVRTFDEEFGGSAVDLTKWNIYGENYWDKQSHFSKANLLVGGGLARLRFCKRRGHQNDDPNHTRVTDYATGFLDTYGKWAQRYGYFEARMKMPTAPGLWPAFWMMPDRGPVLGPQWKRQDTAKGGMELDILEHLTRWGPLRFNIAHHWDGYGKGHKYNGTDRAYARPDQDGFLTAGVLWTPGRTAYYYNGAEVLRWENPRVSTVASIMMFTLPMGGWDNSPLDDSRLPDDFVIDYVRVWQRRDLASAVDGKPPVAAPAPAKAAKGK